MDATAEGSRLKGKREEEGGKLRDPGWHSLIHSSKNRTHFTSKGSCSDPTPRQSESVKYTPCYKQPHLVTKLGSNQKRTHTHTEVQSSHNVCVCALGRFGQVLPNLLSVLNSKQFSLLPTQLPLVLCPLGVHRASPASASPASTAAH